MIKREFVIGDVHGCYKTLHHLLFEIINITKKDSLYFLGDIIDRGPQPREVIELIQNMKKSGYKIRVLKGNHEDLFLNAMDFIDDSNNSNTERWLSMGGAITTYKSFSQSGSFELRNIHRDFFRNLEDYIVLEDFVLCHAGLKFSDADPFNDRYYMVWEREPQKVIPEKIGFRKLITGHSPKTLQQIYDSLSTNHIYLDGGCVHYRTKAGLGYMVALELNSLELFQQICIDFENEFHY